MDNNTKTNTNDDKREALLTQLICEVYYCLEHKFKEDEVIEIVEQMKQEFARTMQDYSVTYMETQITIYHPWETFIKSFSVSKYIEGLSKGTIQVYLLTLKDFFETTNKGIEQITTNDIRAFLFRCESIKQNSKRTVDFKRGVLNVFFEWLVNEEYINNNPARKIKPIKYEENYRQPLTQIELELIRNSCISLRERALVEIMYSTGARVSEISNLDIRDIDFNTKEVIIYGQKTKKYRKCFLNAKAELALKAYLNSRTDGKDYLFCQCKKPYNRLSKNSIENEIIKIMNRCNGLSKKVTPHVFRHTMATTALQNGMNIVEVSKLLGHSDISTTQQYVSYADLDIKSSHSKNVI